MKKTYKNPEMQVVELNVTQHLLEASLPLSGDNATGPGMARPLDEFEGF